jgi:anthraniloyl-CoA monooxygenase
VAAVDRTFAQAGARPHGFDVSVDKPNVPMFQPFRLREMVVANRVVVSPM